MSNMSPFWKTEDLKDQQRCVVRRLEPEGREYPGTVVGYYACDADGHPNSYIVKLDTYHDNRDLEWPIKTVVMSRGCVDKE